MKRTTLKRIGERGRANIEANRRLKLMFVRVQRCEIKIDDGCLGGLYLQFCHRHRRDWYKGNVDMLAAWQEVVVGCTHCHEIMDNNPELKEQIFVKLRG